MIINERNHIASKLVVGIKDKTGETNALSYSEVQETKIANKLLKTEDIHPPKTGISVHFSGSLV